MIKFCSLNQNEHFKKILKQKKYSTNYFTIYFGKNVEKQELKSKILNISFISKKKIGNAVKRNKIKRKLKAAVQKFLKQRGKINLNYTYIIFGKDIAYKEKFENIFNEINNVFEKIK
tara:strand:- start:34 stop:384 length:351 start_codon:yes stop_codon:yes gene_type:complete